MGQKGPLICSLVTEYYMRFKAGLVPAFFCCVDASQGQDRGDEYSGRALLIWLTGIEKK